MPKASYRSIFHLAQFLLTKYQLGVFVVIQLTRTKSVNWTPPWEKSSARYSDVVGVELESGNPEGCPAVRLQRRKGGLALAAVGFIPAPEGALASKWEDLEAVPAWSIPKAFRAKNAAFALNSTQALTRQTAATPFLEGAEPKPEGIAVSTDDVRSVFRKMADESSVLMATIPEYEALWAANLLISSQRPVICSLQTTPCALLSSLAAQPGFCEKGDEAAIFVGQKAIYLAGFRKGRPMLFRECPGVAGVSAMRAAVKAALGLDDTMLETVLASDGVIDTRPALAPILTPVLSQVEISLDYLKSRLGADIKRLFLMGDAMGCFSLRHVLDGRFSLPLETPNPFDGLVPPAKATSWKNQYCIGDISQVFLAALGAALAAMEEAT